MCTAQHLCRTRAQWNMSARRDLSVAAAAALDGGVGRSGVHNWMTQADSRSMHYGTGLHDTKVQKQNDDKNDMNGNKMAQDFRPETEAKMLRSRLHRHYYYITFALDTTRQREHVPKLNSDVVLDSKKCELQAGARKGITHVAVRIPMHTQATSFGLRSSCLI